MKPIIKWAGRKTYLKLYIDEYLRKIKQQNFTYFEPFMGSGAIFFHLAGQDKIEEAYLNDSLKELIILYETIENCDLNRMSKNIQKEIARYRTHSNGRKTDYRSKTKIYKEWKDEFNSLIIPTSVDSLGRNQKIRVSILFLLLNYSCFNGVYRKNPKGMFNVPHGRSANKVGIKDNKISIPDKSIFKKAKELFIETNTNFSSVDFKHALLNVKKGDVVYLDPPYYDSVNYYNEIDFTLENQRELRDEMIRLTELGAHVMMSNSSSKESKQLFNSPHFDIKEIPVTRTIQRKKKANHQYKEDKKELFITSCL